MTTKYNQLKAILIDEFAGSEYKNEMEMCEGYIRFMKCCKNMIQRLDSLPDDETNFNFVNADVTLDWKRIVQLAVLANKQDRDFSLMIDNNGFVTAELTIPRNGEANT